MTDLRPKNDSQNFSLLGQTNPLRNMTYLRPKNDSENSSLLDQTNQLSNMNQDTDYSSEIDYLTSKMISAIKSNDTVQAKYFFNSIFELTNDGDGYECHATLSLDDIKPAVLGQDENLLYILCHDAPTMCIVLKEYTYEQLIQYFGTDFQSNPYVTALQAFQQNWDHDYDPLYTILYEQLGLEDPDAESDSDVESEF